MYWGVTVMDLMGRLEGMQKAEIIQFIVDCQDQDSGGVRPVQGAAIYDCLDSIDIEGVVRFVQSLQQDDGSFW